MPLDRPTFIAELKSSLEADPRITAAWLGGSDASGRADALSDVDLVLATAPDDVEHGFDAVEACVNTLGGFSIKHRIPSPTWHGHEQAFYRLADAPPELMLDLVVMSADAQDKMLELERHGEALVLFDRANVVDPPALDRAAHQKKIDDKLAQIRERFELFQPLIDKAIARGHLPEAVAFYHRLTLAPLIDLLRIKHCPDKFDFGPRYLDRDLPRADYKLVTRLSLHGDADELAANAKTARDHAGRLLNELS